MHTFLLHHLLSESSGTYPDNEAVVGDGESITYSELEIKTGQLARSLTRIGVKEGDRVGIMLNKSIESIIALFGILKAGASYVPIDPLSPAGRVKYIIDNCKMRCVVTSERGALKMLPHLDNTPSLTKVVIAKGDPHRLSEQCGTFDFLPLGDLLTGEWERDEPLEISDASPAYILHTSGSTGFPKGVVISHLNSLTFVNMVAKFFEISENDRLSWHAPLHFDLSVFDIFAAVRSGSAIVLVPETLSAFPVKLAKYMEDTKISVWNSVASVLSLLAERGRLERFPFDSLRLVLFSGEVLPVKYLRVVMNHMKRARFVNIYGQTEANSSTFYPLEEVPRDDGWRIPIGRAFPNFDVFALDEAGEVVKSPGIVGELYVSASTVAMGYWRDREKTEETFVWDPRSYMSHNRVYKTGDLVKIDDRGDYIFLGRKDHQVKSRGYRIQLNEIEFVLNSHPGIKEAVVIAVPDDLVGNRIISYVSLAGGTRLTELEILDYCSMSLPAYMVPEKISFMDDFPKTPTGKTDRKLLLEIACGSIQV